ncbi:MAG TPA: replicative DNA helicase [Elusimicrobiota bacterium]|nr:replicative DNA helicase [Elusimicrobiota bacterium]
MVDTTVLEHELQQAPLESAEAEMAVLGSMLVEREALVKALDLLVREDFSAELHRKIFAALQDLYDKNVTPDVVTLGDHLSKLPGWAALGGPAYLMKLTQTVPTALHVDHYAKIVREKAILRNLRSMALGAIRDCNKQEMSADELLDKIQTAFLNLSEQKTSRGMMPVSQLMHGAITALERLAETKKYITGVSTGFTKIDEMTAGLQPANLIIVAGRPSMGKTAFCLNVAEHVAIKDKKPVLFFSLEMSDQDMGLRLLCSQTRINLRAVREGFLARKSWASITNVASQITAAPLYFDFSTSPTILEVRSAARRWSHELRQKGQTLSLIIIDYLQLLRSASRMESRQQEISDISRSLKALARELNVPVIALSQLNRRTEERGREGRPQLSDLRESGALEQDADLVMAIFRECVYKQDDPDLKNKALICILKQRNGPIGDVELAFFNDYTRFENMSSESEETF